MTLLPWAQGTLVSELLRVNSQVDGLLLQRVAVLGVPSPPQHVLVNGALVDDFSYRTDTEARPQAPGRCLG